MNANIKKSNDIFHVGFEIGLLLKGINGILEIMGGLVLLLMNPGRLNRLIYLLTHNELSEDPQDFFANLLVKLGHGFTIDTQYFGVFYFVSHGIVKCALIFLMWKKKLWAYPLAIAFFILFIIYQLYRYTLNHSVSLIVLTISDIVIIALTAIEYRRNKINLTQK